MATSFALVGFASLLASEVAATTAFSISWTVVFEADFRLESTDLEARRSSASRRSVSICSSVRFATSVSMAGDLYVFKKRKKIFLTCDFFLEKIIRALEKKKGH